MKFLWTEKYRPRALADYVFQNSLQRDQVLKWIQQRNIPNLLMHGGPGTGKTTLARLLVQELNIHAWDLLELNASRERRLEDVRVKITNFVSTIPFADLKVVLLDEADGLTPDSQAALRNLIEEHASTCRFILTCNYGHKIIPALHSRCQEFHIERLDHTEFTSRVATVLLSEQINFDLDVLDTYVKTTYPDLRKCINLCEQNCISGVLQLSTGNSSSADYLLQAVDLFKAARFREARQLICQHLRADELDQLISWCYQNLQLWSSSAEGQDEAILIIRRAAVNASLVADQEINVAAMFVELAQISN